MNRTVLLLATAGVALVFTGYAQSGDQYVAVGKTTDIKCPAHLKLEEGFVPNPEFKLTPDQALVAAQIRCPNKLVVTVFADSKNYYITTLGAKPGTVGTYVVNGKSGDVSFRRPK